MSNIILAAFFLVQFIVILNYLLVSIFEKYTSFYIQIAFIYYPFVFLWGPLIYFYVKSQVTLNFKLKYANLVHLIPFVFALLFIVSYYYVSDNEMKLQIINNKLIYKKFFYFNFPYYLLLFGYNLSALSTIIKYQQNLKNYCSFVEKRNLIYLKFVLFGYILACLITFLTSFANIPYQLKMLTSFSLFLAFFNILFYKAMIEPYVIIIPEEKPKYLSSSLDNTEIQVYSKTIESSINVQKLYLNPTLTISDLAEATGIPEKTISQVINQQYNQNFFSFINSRRVEEAKILLNSFDQNKTTMLAVAFDSGFNSKTAFYDAFKRHTRMTPTEYRKLKA